MARKPPAWQGPTTFACQFQLDEADHEAGTFAGIASVFNSLVQGFVPTVVERGAFAQTIREDLARIKIFWEHQDLIGFPLALEERPEGLFVQGKISQTTLGRDALILLRDGRDTGHPMGLSIGFDPVDWEMRKIPGLNRDEPVRVLKQLRLWEISPVSFPADTLAQVLEVAGRCPMCGHGAPAEISQLEREPAESQAVPRNVSNEIVEDLSTPWTTPTLQDFTDQPWEELTAAEQRRIAGHYAWAPTLPPERFADLKLPHHRPKDGWIVWRGVVGAMAALLGARGGVDIPASDRRPVYDHLADEYRRFDREPPEFRAGTLEEVFGRQLESLLPWIPERHVGKVLSTKNRGLVREAINALVALLEAAGPDDNEDAPQARIQRELDQMAAQLGR